MATSQIAAYLDALAAGLSGSLPNVTVVDGPPPTWNTSDPLSLFLGARPDGQTANGEQEYRTAGNVSRYEQMTVQCAVYAWTGDTEIKPVRDACFLVLAAVEEFIRSNAAVRAVANIQPGRLSSVSVEEWRDSKNTHCRLSFSIEAAAYLN